MSFEELKKLNEDKLNLYHTKLNEAEKQNNTVEILNLKKEIDIHKKIQKLLEKNPGIFFQISMEDALKILSKLVNEKDLKNTYVSMIDPQKYAELKKKFEI
jgi:hypothetical protein